MHDILLSTVQELTNFGAAGLMGTMWLIERKLSRTREEQLADAHKRITRDEEKLSCLTDVISRNTAAIVRLVQNQDHQAELLKHLLEEFHHKPS